MNMASSCRSVYEPLEKKQMLDYPAWDANQRSDSSDTQTTDSKEEPGSDENQSSDSFDIHTTDRKKEVHREEYVREEYELSDSFKFHSGYTTDEDIEYDGDGFYEMTKEEWDLYREQVDASDGFDVPYFPKAFICAAITPLQNLHSSDDIESINQLSELAIEHYNREHSTYYKFVKVAKANAQVVCGIFYYITFEAKAKAKNGDDGEPEIFQAKVLWGLEDIKKVDFCRLKPY